MALSPPPFYDVVVENTEGSSSVFILLLLQTSFQISGDALHDAAAALRINGRYTQGSYPHCIAETKASACLLLAAAFDESIGCRIQPSEIRQS